MNIQIIFSFKSFRTDVADFQALSINQILKSSKINLYLVGKSHISFAQPFTKKRERRRSGEFKLGDFNFSRDFVAHIDCY